MDRLSGQEYKDIYGRVPRSCVDTILLAPGSEPDLMVGRDGICNAGGPLEFALVQRSIPPYLGHWHLPGGTLRRHESILAASRRLVAAETGIERNRAFVIGSYEILSEEGQVEIDGVMQPVELHSVVHVVLAFASTRELKRDSNADRIGWFSEMPTPYIPAHGEWLVARRFARDA